MGGGVAKTFETGTYTGEKLENNKNDVAAEIKPNATVTLKDFTVTSNTNSENFKGAGIFVNGSSQLTIENGTFTNNKYLTPTSQGFASGGAISTSFKSHEDGGDIADDIVKMKITLKGDNKFTENEATYAGGAIFIRGKNKEERATLEIDANGTAKFEANKAQDGGAISNNGVANLYGETTFTKNEARNAGGALNNLEYGEVLFGKKAIFSENKATYYGGAINNTGKITFKGGAEFNNNTAKVGGAIYNNSGTIVFSGGNYDFTGNTASEKPNDIYNRGGQIKVTDNATVTLTGGILSKDYIDNNNPSNSSTAQVLVSGDKNTALILAGESEIDHLNVQNKGRVDFAANAIVGNLKADRDTRLTVKDGAKLTLTGKSAIGIISLGSVNGANIEVGSDLSINDLQVNGQSELYVTNAKSTISIEHVSSADKLSIQGSGSVNDAHDGKLDELLKQIKLKEGSSLTNSTIGYNEGTVIGAVTGTVNEKGEIVGVKEDANKNNVSVLNKLEKSQRVLISTINNDLRKRLGDVRSGGSGVWARISGAGISGDNSFESDVKMVQVGADTTIEGTNLRLGTAFGYGKADSDDNYGSADFDAYSVAGYGVWMNEAGQFVDVVARYTNFYTDLTDRGQTASLTNNALSLSSEFGWRFNLTDSVFVEPSVELAYTHIDGDSYALGTTKYDYDSLNSFQGRAGFMAGLKCPNDYGNVYVRAAVVREFSGDAELRATAANTSRVVTSEGKDTWFEYGVGANFNVAKTSQVYVDLERTSGSVIDEDWRANVGVRYNF